MVNGEVGEEYSGDSFRGMSREVFWILCEPWRGETFRLLDAVSGILVPVQGDFLEGAGVREGS